MNIMASNKINLEPIKINDQLYYTVKQFAILTNHSEQSIRRLITYGNKIRKIKIIHISDKPFILASELKDFNFTLPGKSVETYNYGEKN